MINSSISGASQIQPSHRHHGGGKGGQEMKALGDALNSGDLSAAQKAFQSLQANAPKPGTAAAAQNPASSDIAALSQALQSGDITAAQKAFAAIQQDFQSRKPSHLGRQQPTQPVPDVDASDSGTGIAVNISA